MQQQLPASIKNVSFILSSFVKKTEKYDGDYHNISSDRLTQYLSHNTVFLSRIIGLQRRVHFFDALKVKFESNFEKENLHRRNIFATISTNERRVSEHAIMNSDVIVLTGGRIFQVEVCETNSHFSISFR